MNFDVVNGNLVKMHTTGILFIIEKLSAVHSNTSIVLLDWFTSSSNHEPKRRQRILTRSFLLPEAEVAYEIQLV